ncbi:MAG: cysteine peptidase family C39 domain-containing protein [Isosphaeraceae bacterium]
MRRLGRLSLSLTLAFIVLACFCGKCEDTGGGSRGSGAYDCGILALRQLAKLEGRGEALERLRAALPAPRAEGYSMKDLRLASLACGLRLTGVFLGKDERAIDRPMLMYLRRGSRGHFLVVRPVGVTGKLVQLIDSVRAPEVMDKSELFSSREWTGLALVPNPPRWASRPVALALSAAALAAVVLVCRSLHGRSRARKDGR